jgi:HKD family nuclease
MRVLLHPLGKDKAGSLQDLYDKAISEARELFIVSAYLTGWSTKKSISSACQKVTFIVGTDFGITRKAACRKVLNWLPKKFKSDFLAADSISGFHPKLVIWKDAGGKCWLVLGSSNLTQAAFTNNYEANVFAKLTVRDYDNIKAWVYEIKLGCSPVSEDWLSQYKEMTQKANGHGNWKPPVKPLPAPVGISIDKAILDRRIKHNAFKQIRPQLLALISQCANKQITDEEFYAEMMISWGTGKSRLQGKGFEIKGKNGNWQDVCQSILLILIAAPTMVPTDLDDVVRKEVDRLAQNDNPNRGAWMSEMLCQYLPAKYPLVNKPVRTWLRHIKYRAPRKASEGARYIDLARKLRLTVMQHKNRARDLLELDGGIWKWYDNKRRKAGGQLTKRMLNGTA